MTIKVENLSKIYKLYDKPIDRLKESMHPFKKKYHRDFYALKDIKFEIARGETVGIIGKNGSGKSTLLKIVAGVLSPSSGTVKVDGKVSALLELGTGFNPELNGIENIYFSGTIMGYTREAIDKKLDNILSFADIGDFIYQPLKTYSSGMFVRLAFAVATNIDPEILIIDEALAVGDMFFQAKSMTHMKKMMDSGVTVIFVSHDTGAIKSLCKQAILLDSGILVDYDRADKIEEKYFALKVMSEQKVVQKEIIKNEQFDNENNCKIKSETWSLAFSNNSDFQKRASYQRIQNGKANFVNVQLLDENDNQINHVDYEQLVTLRMAVEVCEDIHMMAFGYHIRDVNGVYIVYSDSIIENKSLNYPKKGDRYIIDWKFKVSLKDGTFNIICVLSIPINLTMGQVDFCDFIPLAVQFQVLPKKISRLYGGVHWENEVIITNI